MTGTIPAALWDSGPLQRADLTLAQIEASIGDLATQLGASGARPEPLPVLRARYELAVHRFGPAGAQDAFDRWATAVAVRDAADPAPIASAAAAVIGTLPWCPHCDRADLAGHLAVTGHPDDAIRLATRLLDAAPGSLCPEQPAGVISAVLPALLLTGQAERAARQHLVTVRLLETSEALPRLIRARASQLLTCARTGRLQHAVDLLQGWIGWLDNPTPPYLRMQLAAAGGRVLRDVSEAGQGDLLIRRRIDGEDEEITVQELGTSLLQEARDIAARFDERNQTQAASELVDEFLDAPGLPDLPLDAFLRSPRFAAVPTRAPDGPRGRRARAGQDPDRAAADRPVVSALAREFDAALACDSQSRRSAVMTTWRAIRARHELDIGEDGQYAARLDGWLAIEDLHAWPSLAEPDQATGPLPAPLRAAGPPAEPERTAADLLEQAQAATRRLASAGLPLEARLHEQAALLAAAQSGAAHPGSVRPRIEAIAAEVAKMDQPADLGLAHSRVALIRELDLTSTEPAGSDAVELGLAALEAVPSTELNHQQARALARLLRLRAGAEDPEVAGALLERAIVILPDGVRPVERALARSDLATLLQEIDLPAAVRMWRAAIADAATADAEPLIGSVLAAGALARQAAGDLDGAIADLIRAVPLLDQHAGPELAAQSRFDLARALIAAQRYAEGATAAESALADLTHVMTAGLTVESAESAGAQADPALAHLAGCAAFTAAEAVAAIGDRDQARVLAELSAGWHEANGNLVAEAEAWHLAARIGGSARRVASDLERAAELAEMGGEWSRAASCRRDRATAVKEADGVDAALDVLADAEKILISRENVAGRHVSDDETRAANRLMLWHRMTLNEQRARMLAVTGRFDEALAAVDGLEDGYTALGDDWSARDLLGLRGQLRAELGDLPGALSDLERAAVEAVDAGDRDQASGLGERLAVVLDQAGRSWDAEQAYQRFCAEPADRADRADRAGRAGLSGPATA